MSALRTLGMNGYELIFLFCERPGYPPKAILYAFRKTADEVIELLDYLGRQHLVEIKLTYIEDINETVRSSGCAGPPKYCKIGA